MIRKCTGCEHSWDRHRPHSCTIEASNQVRTLYKYIVVVAVEAVEGDLQAGQVKSGVGRCMSLGNAAY